MKNKKSLMGQRGFLGPIGDDLPSLIPLVFALIIFFGAFGVAFSTFTQRGHDFDLQIEALRISTDLKGNSYFASFVQFQETCDSINAKGIKFRGGLIELKPDLPQRVDIFNPVFYTDKDGKTFKCENTEDELSRARLAQQNPITRDFPVALNENFTVKPMVLVITIWK